MGGETCREESLRIGVHHADAVVWGPVYTWGLSVAVEHVGERATRLFHEVGALVPVDQRAQALHAVARDELRFPSPDVAHSVRAHRGVAHREEELVSMLRIVPYERTSGWS